jgi:hypothetical protein
MPERYLAMTDLVRLNEKGVRAYTSRAGSKHGSRMNWPERVGKIIKYNRGRSLAYVLWDGTRTFDRVPVDLIEPCGSTTGRQL